jgi:hypothetical protein
MPSMMGKRFFTVVNNLSGVVVRNFFSVFILVSVNTTLPMDSFLQITLVLRTRKFLEVRTFLI